MIIMILYLPTAVYFMVQIFIKLYCYLYNVRRTCVIFVSVALSYES